MSKFISAKRPVNYANRLNEVKKEMEALRERMRELKAEEESLEQFLFNKAAGENFEFNGDDGFVMKVEFADRSRQDIDRQRVQAIFAKLGKKVPMKTSEWIETKVSYVTE